MKYEIMGYSGSGKSTLAGYISKKMNVPVLYMDTIQFMPNWQERDLETKIQLTKEFLDQHDRWVIDGNYTRVCFERRCEEADQIIIMKFNRFNCFIRALKRYFKYKGKTRDSMTVGCDEKFDLEFAMWILKDGRTKKVRDRHRMIQEKYPDKTVVIHNQRELNKFMESGIKGLNL